MPADLRKTLLIIDDDRLFRDVVAQYFSGEKVSVFSAHTGAEGLAVCARERVDVVLLDQQLPDVEGKTLCPAILSRNDRTKIIFVTGYPSFDNAVEAIKFGAYDYLSKPLELEELELAVNKAFHTHDLERVEQVQTYIARRESEETVLIGRENGLKDLDKLIDLAASSDAPVLITGETGTGKSFIARAIHYRGRAGRGGYINVNCASFPENLIESELFGYERGAFSGAVSAKRGIFEMAEGGTLALEEIGELPIHLQSKLLGVLDDKKVRRLGGETARPVDARIVATTNVELEEAVGAGRFRQDLYYRLSVMRLHVPPLRTRGQDVPELCRFFIQGIAPSQNIELPEEELVRLKTYAWPGNVRELRNVIERAIILRSGPTIRPSELLTGPIKTTTQTGPLQTDAIPDLQNLSTLKDVEKEHIRKTLTALDHNHTRAANALGVSRSTLMRKIKEYGV